MRYMYLISVVVFIFFTFITDAQAYIDPGTGSAVLQGILGAIAALALTAKLWWHKLLVMLGIRKRRPRSERAEQRQPSEKE